MRPALLFPISLLLLNVQAARAADFSPGSTAGAGNVSERAMAGGPGPAGGVVQTSDEPGHHLSASERAKLREQVRLQWLERRAPATAGEPAAATPLADAEGRAFAR
ncbi:hypothetical protein [Variovorax sp.]|uniref:hypothetical protein n=1 Tax=Variovorax sp. TaxID=1871043 RepID=UPI002D2AFA6A|nr:hypothetical protein [Variovorax sp.]HYP86352.1 hypothetical protein [Variovorax sp.]